MPDRQALFYAQIMEVSTIQLRLADPSYLEFLRNFEPHVPMKRRPYLWPILLDGITYGIPITTQDTGANFPGFLSDGNRGLNMRFMIPLPEQALLPAPKGAAIGVADGAGVLRTEPELYYCGIQTFIRFIKEQANGSIMDAP